MKMGNQQNKQNRRKSMSKFDPNFEFFGSAKRRTSAGTDHDSKFEAFREHVLHGKSNLALTFQPPFVIQFVCHPNFEQHRKTISYFIHNEATNDFEPAQVLTPGFRRANSYHNYVTDAGVGHPKGLYFELNLYTMGGVSPHHTSRVKGIDFVRDDSHDLREFF